MVALWKHDRSSIDDLTAWVTARLAIPATTSSDHRSPYAGRDAKLLLRETLVVGRTGEAPGLLRTSTEVHQGGTPVIIDQLELSAATQVPGILGHHRVLDAVLALGHPPQEHPSRLDLEHPGQLYRVLAGATHQSDLGDLWRTLQSLTEV